MPPRRVELVHALKKLHRTLHGGKLVGLFGVELNLHSVLMTVFEFQFIVEPHLLQVGQGRIQTDEHIVGADLERVHGFVL